VRHGFLLYLASSAYEGQPAMINQSEGPACADARKSVTNTEDTEETKGTKKEAQLGFYLPSCTPWPPCSLLLLGFRHPTTPAQAIVSSLARISPAMQNSTRRSAHEIFEQVVKNAREELSRSVPALLFSGCAGAQLSRELSYGKVHLVLFLSDWVHRGDHWTRAALY